jgi:type II secretory pathway pseudopilin PulG
MELLTVVAIISILMALLLPVLNVVKNNARKAEARSDCSNLQIACRSYYTDYGVYPLNSNQASAGAAGTDTCYGDPNGLYSSADLCDILRAMPDSRYNTNNILNSRQVIYFEANNAKDQTNPKGGFYEGQGNGNATSITGPAGNKILPGSYLDPWGMEYVVFLDANYDGNLNAAIQWFYYTNPIPAVNTSVAACSLGADHTWGANGNGGFYASDDIATWQ